jgi:hypothetical protein
MQQPSQELQDLLEEMGGIWEPFSESSSFEEQVRILHEGAHREKEILNKMTDKVKREIHGRARQIQDELRNKKNLEDELHLLQKVCPHEGDPDECIYCGADLYDPF